MSPRPSSSLAPVIGIDIGGTKMAVAAIDPANHRILARSVLSTDAALGFDRAVRRLIETVERLLEQTGDDRSPASIGVGCAGPVDPLRGLINNPYTLEGWDRCDLVTPLREHFGTTVRLENDADAAALGEVAAGAGCGANPVVMLTFGTGVGGATILNGRIHRGVRGEHPELGHVPVRPDGPKCYCGIAGCLESLVSGTALGMAGAPFGWSDARAVFAAADRGEPRARELVERATEAGATAAWTICHALLPQRLVLGGGMMETEFERFAEPMRRRLAAGTQFTPAAVEIVPARLGNDAGLIGAAALVSGPAAS